MTNLTVQLVLKITQSLDNKLDKAFIVFKERGNNLPTRTDYIRFILEECCNQELADYKEIGNNYIRDTILNKVIWVIFSRLAMEKCDDIIFRALHLDEFVYGARTKVEEVFKYLADEGCVKIGHDHKGFVVISNFNEELLKKIALKNIKNEDAMNIFGDLISKWNTGKGVPISDICFHMFSIVGLNVKIILSDNGFIITDNSNCHIQHMQGYVKDGPSEYARQLWNIPFFKNGEKQNSLYVTFPDIYIGQK